MRTRHFHVRVQAPNKPVLTTQLYFPSEPGNQGDGIFRPELVMAVRDEPGAKAAAFDFVICTVPPIPSSERAYHLGEVLREIVTTRWPADVRVAVVATGGLSHEPGRPRYLQVDEAFDRWFLEHLAEGDHRRIVRECTVERMETAGSGGTAELIAWIAALPFTAGPVEVLGYAPTLAWRTGTGMVDWPRLT